MRAFAISLLVFVLLSQGKPVAADNSMTPSGISLELIMADPDWKGNDALNPYWSDDGKFVYYEQKRDDETFNDIYRVDVETGAISQIVTSELSSVDAPNGHYNADFTRKVTVRNGDIFIKDLASEKLLQVTRSAVSEHDARFMPDGIRIVFGVGNDFFIFDPERGNTAQIAEFRLEDDPLAEDTSYTFLEQQQDNLIATLAWKERRDKSAQRIERQRRNIDGHRLAEPFFLGSKIEIVSASASPSGNHIILVTQPKAHDNGPNEHMPNYVTTDGYVADREVRSKVGQNTPAAHSVILLDVINRDRTDIAMDTLPGIKDDPMRTLRRTALDWHVKHGANRAEIEKQLKAPEVRRVQVENMAWNDQGTAVALQIYSNDNKDRWLVTVDLERGRLVTQHRLSFRNGWVNYAQNDFGWSRDGNTLWYLSEEDGYSHLYTKHVNQRRATQLTKGRFVVESPYLDRAGENYYVIANRRDPGDYRVYRVPAEGGELVELTSVFAGNTHLLPDNGAPFSLSPDESQLLFKHATANRHPEIYLQENQAGAEAKQLSFTISDKFLGYPWFIPEFVQVPSSNFEGTIHARVYTPDNYDPAKSYPAIMFVHGAGYLHNAHKGWSLYFREYMFNNLLREHGFVVMDMDFRGSRGYGRDWRTSIYRNMGHPELDDLVDGVEWLTQNKAVDRKRVGIYGGSYGGFMTFMALFRTPETFAA
ncbi:MAG: prolyl oligopeptidase family serine peptidase, partial [Gammaproteobacteria bacterium]